MSGTPDENSRTAGLISARVAAETVCPIAASAAPAPRLGVLPPCLAVARSIVSGAGAVAACS